MFRVAAAGHGEEPAVVVCAKRVERSCEPAEVRDVRNGNIEEGNPVTARVDAGNFDELLRIGVRKRPQQHAVNRAEDGGRGADAERERPDRDCREERASPQHPCAVSQIVREHVEAPFVLPHPHDQKERTAASGQETQLGAGRQLTAGVKA